MNDFASAEFGVRNERRVERGAWSVERGKVFHLLCFASLLFFSSLFALRSSLFALRSSLYALRPQPSASLVAKLLHPLEQRLVVEE